MFHTTDLHPTRLAPTKAVPRLGLLFLLFVAPREGCTFSIGPNGLCASFRVDPQDEVLRVGDTFRVRINADGCTAAATCACADSALIGAQWRSDAPETASVDSAGVVTGRRQGRADIIILPASTTSWRQTRVHVTVVP